MLQASTLSIGYQRFGSGSANQKRFFQGFEGYVHFLWISFPSFFATVFAFHIKLRFAFTMPMVT
jgi:hypothetical protein